MEFEDLFVDFPHVSQRADQKEYTGQLIVAAAIALVHQGGEDAVTMRAVARMVEISERTVYRHFANRDALLEAVWDYLRKRVRIGTSPDNADALIERPRRTFPLLDEESEKMRAYLRALERRRLPVEVQEETQAAAYACAEDALEGADSRTLRWRAAIAHVITSPYAWDLMNRYWGFDGEEAGEAAAQAVEVLLDRRSSRDGEVKRARSKAASKRSK